MASRAHRLLVRGRSTGKQVLKFGRHKGKTFEQVLAAEPGYVEWVRGLDSSSGQVQEFRAWVGQQAVPARPVAGTSTPPRKSVVADIFRLGSLGKVGAWRLAGKLGANPASARSGVRGLFPDGGSEAFVFSSEDVGLCVLALEAHGGVLDATLERHAGWEPSPLQQAALGAALLSRSSQLGSREPKLIRLRDVAVELWENFEFQGIVISGDPCIEVRCQMEMVLPGRHLGGLPASLASRLVGCEVVLGRLGSGYIERVLGPLGEHRARLAQLVSKKATRAVLEATPDHELVYAVVRRGGRGVLQLDYIGPMLRPVLTLGNARNLARVPGYEDLDWKGLLRAMVRAPAERRAAIEAELRRLAGVCPWLLPDGVLRSVSSGDFPKHFTQLPAPEFVLGGGARLQGSASGGQLMSAIRRNGLFATLEHLPALKLSGWRLGPAVHEREAERFLQDVRQAIRAFGVPCESEGTLEAAPSVAEAVARQVARGQHAALWFEEDASASVLDVKGASLRAPGVDGLPHIVSQMVTPKVYTTARDDVASSVALQLLAKLGMTPWTLAPVGAEQPPWVVDHGIDFLVGLDVCRKGGRHLTAGCGYWRPTGQLHTSIWDAAETGGETISRSVLRSLLPAALCAGKTLMIHRDGRWVGAELACLTQHARDVGLRVFPVSVVKGLSLIPRLYASEPTRISKCDSGTVFRVDDTEAIVATNPAKGQKMGTPMPLRVKVHPTVGGPAGAPDMSILAAVEAVYWLSRVHYSSVFQQPRLPVTIKAVDEASWLLNTPEMLDSFRARGPLNGPQQFWL